MENKPFKTPADTDRFSLRIPGALGLEIREAADLMYKGNVNAFFIDVVEKALHPFGHKAEEKQSAGAPKVEGERLRDYLLTKGAAMTFEDDVFDALAKCYGAENVKKGVKYSGTLPFVADFQVRTYDKVFSVVCKSSPKKNRLQLAVAESIIGRTVSMTEVAVVVPYFTEDVRSQLPAFEASGVRLLTVEELQKCDIVGKAPRRNGPDGPGM